MLNIIDTGRERVIGIIRQYRIRVCKKRGTPLRTYDGFNTNGLPVKYIRDIPVVVFKHYYSCAKSVFRGFLPKFG